MNLNYLLPPIIAGVICLALGMVVIFSNFRNRTHRLFAYSIFGFAGWAFTIFFMRSSPNMESALFWDRMVFPFAAAGVVFYLHFTIKYSNASFPRFVLFLAYLSFTALPLLLPKDLFIPAMQIKPYGYAPIPGVLFLPVLFIQYIWVGLAGTNLIRGYKKAISYEEKNRIVYLLSAVCAFLVLALFDFLPLFGLPLYPGAILGNILFCLLTVLGISKHNLLDVRIVIRKGTAYMLISAIIIIIYAMAIFIFSRLFHNKDIESWAYVILVTVIAFALRPIWLKVQHFVDILFYRNRYDHIKALQLFNNKTHNIMDGAILGSNMVTAIANALRSEAVYLFLPSSEKNGLILKYSSDVDPINNKVLLKNRSPLIKYLTQSDQVVSMNDFEIVPQLQSITVKEKDFFQTIKAELFVPLRIGATQLTGIIVLSRKLSEQSYSIEEKQLVQTISNEMAIKLENARLYDNALRTRQNLETWLNSMADPILIIDTNFVLQFINKPGKEIFGGQIGSMCWKALGNNSKCPFCTINITPSTTRNTSQYMTKIKTNEYNVAIAPILNPDGTQSIIEVFRDITEIKKAEEDRKKMEAQLNQAQRMEAVGTLAGGIAHDFNNLLMGILGYNSLMLTDVDPLHPHYENLTEIEGFVKSAVDLTKQLLGFARGGKYETKATDMNALIKNHNRIFGRTRKEVTILGTYDKNLWTSEVDRGQMEQVLMNLYVNAWQAMNDRGEIFVRTENIVIDADHKWPFEVIPGRYIKFSVTDTGIGMDKKTMEKIFDPFFTTKEKERGTGMGLSSTYGIIKNHGGFITVDSKPGHGSTFNIYLPASTQKAEKDMKDMSQIIKGSGVILLIDDEKMILQVGEKLLKKLGYDVLLASSGYDGITTYKQHQENITIIILDMIMPDMTGSETFEHLKNIDPDAKILLSSGYSLDGKAKQILKQGCNGFIQKPFNINQLSQKLNEICAN